MEFELLGEAQILGSKSTTYSVAVFGSVLLLALHFAVRVGLRRGGGML